MPQKTYCAWVKDSSHQVALYFLASSDQEAEEHVKEYIDEEFDGIAEYELENKGTLFQGDSDD